MNWYQNCLKPLQIAFLGGAIATTSLTFFGTAWCQSVRAALQDSPKVVVDEAWQIVNREYVDPDFNQIDWLRTREELLDRQYTAPEEAYRAIRSALKQLQDPYTRFLDPKQFQRLTEQTSGELSGVGIFLELHPQTRQLTVVKPYENSPASKAGILSGDTVLSIDGRSTQGMSVRAASQLIRGEIGSQVELEIDRPGWGPFAVALTRAKIEVPSVSHAVKYENSARIGYIRLDEFSSHAAEQMERSIMALEKEKVDAFVLDLRGNPGGLLESSIEIARMWLDEGAIVSTIDRDGNREAVRANGSALTQRPLAVLVDQRSASSSEILTGALQDNRRAKIIGTKTFGKALVQAVHSLSDGSGLAVTVAHYYTPKGTDISKMGITPDIPIQLSQQQQRRLVANRRIRATQSDPHYTRAIATLMAQLEPKPLALTLE
ncbi:carboxyl-terminal processing protease CtpB [Roseofilum casamattae]|uniref:S41 family peptidase n=1 Tax=Roseofilum casamattae BLCC-M143 TaxID=3022442 RepID=A0ABT7BZS9_9CYAN|nr:carboxyl-terminal processing protease CtpB [Roseofilum casamattae]MDJ1183773.1 S41 family peptidase [Roseofilum casamattae BLCC-M143]